MVSITPLKVRWRREWESSRSCSILKKDYFAVVELDDSIVGSVAINGLTDDTALLRWFLLHPSMRGRGLGKKLLEEALDFCRQRGFKTVSLWTISELKTAAHLYRAAGFRVVEENTRDFGEPFEQNSATS